MQMRHDPAALILTRQALPTFDRTRYASAEGVQRGAYVLADADDRRPQVLLLATGSEVSLCLDAYEKLKAEGIKVRVVSMPSWEIFERTVGTIRNTANSPAETVTARVAVEEASTLGWARYVGSNGQIIGLDTFGASAPLKELQKKFGFVARQHVVARPSSRSRSKVNHASRDRCRSCRIRAEGGGERLLDGGETRGPRRGHVQQDPVDYSDYAEAVGEALREHRAERGIIICGSGVGASMAANRIPGIRAGLCHDTYSAHQGVEHDDMNVLVLGGRVVGSELAQELSTHS